jgi:hypothetical protein
VTDEIIVLLNLCRVASAIVQQMAGFFHLAALKQYKDSRGWPLRLQYDFVLFVAHVGQIAL